ncbi:MAG TPA: LuxR C-terminal-related transcriptional regulator [Thermomicrobiales bacterium]|nr:LuxR C-terminal-related transcriptional regulator [Thermomicrobiales bacterium]
MQMQHEHDAAHAPPAAETRCPVTCWLEAAERELQEALDLSRASSHQCLMALAALSQLRAFVESSRAEFASPGVISGSLRVLPGQLRADSGFEIDRRDQLVRPSVAANRDPGLSSREIEVLIEIAGGRSNKQIALHLCLSIRTVERHINNIYRKIDAQNKADATAWALRHNLA